MADKNGSAQHDGRRGEAYVTRLSNQYVEHFPETDLVGLQITNALNACYHAHRAALSKRFENLGLAKTLGRSTVLRALYFAGKPLTHNDIATDLEITPGSVTYLVDGLERDGLVKRAVDQTDRRTVFVKLTPSGSEVSGRITPVVADLASQMCHSFTEEEQGLFRDLLFKYLRSARQDFNQDNIEPVEGITKS